MKKIKQIVSVFCAGMVLIFSNSALSAGPGAAAVKGVRIAIVTASVNNAIGKPYVWGTSGPSSFDCSGLAWYAYHKNAGIDLGPEQCSVNIS